MFDDVGAGSGPGPGGASIRHPHLFYTREQEADEISLEVLATIGMPPSLGPESELQLHKVVNNRKASFGISNESVLSWEQCAAIRDRGWRDTVGQPISVPVGDLSDPHHSFCFRIFNMDRELAAHSYKIADQRPRPPGETFAKLVNEMQADVAAAPPPAH